ncbi:MAG: hypothetical protein IKU33_05055 [Bacteroidales bacterium]|nr:hypothetical protein [Bacteroidales bacterium]
MKSLISSLHLKTMPLSLAGVVLGCLLAVADFHVYWTIVPAVILAAASLHIYQYGGSRIALLSSVVFAVISVYFSFGKFLLLESLLLLLFTYFVMRLAKGFLSTGKGGVADMIVLAFLTGPVAVFGSYYLCSHSFGSWVLLFPSLSVGIIAAATAALADRFRKTAASVIMAVGLVLMTVYPFLRIYDPAHFRFVIMIPIYIMLIVRMCTDKIKGIEAYQPIFAFCLLTLAVITGLGYVTYLF